MSGLHASDGLVWLNGVAMRPEEAEALAESIMRLATDARGQARLARQGEADRLRREADEAQTRRDAALAKLAALEAGT